MNRSVAWCPSWCVFHEAFGNQMVHHSADTSLVDVEGYSVSVDLRVFNGSSDPDLGEEHAICVATNGSIVAQLTPAMARTIGAALVALADLGGLQRSRWTARREGLVDEGHRA